MTSDTKTTEPTVFVVDDDGGLRDALGDYLQAVGLSVIAYPSAEAFLDGFDPNRSGCLVLDLRMPGMGGIALQAALARMNIPLPVIIVTAHANVEVAVRSIQSGALHVLEKPYDPDTLLELIHKAIALDQKARQERELLRHMAERVARLTQREQEVMRLLTIGHANNDIAEALGISPRTVEAHRARIMQKTEADSMAQLVRMSISCQVTPLNNTRHNNTP